MANPLPCMKAEISRERRTRTCTYDGGSGEASQGPCRLLIILHISLPLTLYHNPAAGQVEEERRRVPPFLAMPPPPLQQKKCDEEEKAIYIKLGGANGGGPSHEAVSLSFPLMASWAVAQEMRKKKLFSPNQKKGAV